MHGDMFGLVVRAQNIFGNIGRSQARNKQWREARARGADAVVATAMHFDCNEIGDIMSEVTAYGTAVTVIPSRAADTEHGAVSQTEPRP